MCDEVFMVESNIFPSDYTHRVTPRQLEELHVEPRGGEESVGRRITTLLLLPLLLLVVVVIVIIVERRADPCTRDTRHHLGQCGGWATDAGDGGKYSAKILVKHGFGGWRVPGTFEVNACAASRRVEAMHPGK